MEEDESESGFEDMKTDEEYEEELDPHSSKFRAEGQLMAYEEEPNFEGYLSVRVCVHMDIVRIHSLYRLCPPRYTTLLIFSVAL